jgi:hypothetical protein
MAGATDATLSARDLYVDSRTSVRKNRRLHTVGPAYALLLLTKRQLFEFSTQMGMSGILDQGPRYQFGLLLGLRQFWDGFPRYLDKNCAIYRLNIQL